MSYDISKLPDEMQKRYSYLPEEITELFEYGTVNFVTKEIARDFGLTKENEALLRVEIDIVLFFFLTREGLSERIQESLQIEKNKADEIVQKLENDLFSIVEDLLVLVEKNFAGDLETVNEPIIIKTPTSTDQKKPEPAADTKEKEIPDSSSPQLKPLRTFAMDVDVSRAHSYGAFHSGEPDEDEGEKTHRSSQDDVLGGRK